MPRFQADLASAIGFDDQLENDKIALAIGQHSAHCLFIGFINQGSLTQAHLAAWSLLCEDVAQILPSALKLS